MKYVTMFHMSDMTIIDTVESNEKPQYIQGDYVTITKGEVYKIVSFKSNHDLDNGRVFVYVTVKELSLEDKLFMESVIS